MGKKIVFVKVGSTELDPQKSGAKLLAKVVTGRITKEAVQAAKLLVASEAWQALVGDDNMQIIATIKSDKETREYTTTTQYIDAMAAVDPIIFEMVSSKVVEGTGKRGRRKTKVTAEIEF